MKPLVTICIGFILGGSGATAFWYYRLFVPWTEQDVREKQAEAKLLNMYATKLEAGEVDNVISLLKLDSKTKIADSKILTDYQEIEEISH